MELGLPPERVTEVEEDIRRRDHERFILQQQQHSNMLAGIDRLYTRPVPRPEPFTPPQHQGITLNPAPPAEEATQQKTDGPGTDQK